MFMRDHLPPTHRPHLYLGSYLFTTLAVLLLFGLCGVLGYNRGPDAQSAWGDLVHCA